MPAATPAVLPQGFMTTKRFLRDSVEPMTRDRAGATLTVGRITGAEKAVPHPIPYQGSKRALAQTILGLFPADAERVVEPFAGSAAVSLAALYHERATSVLMNDINKPLMGLWQAIIDAPDELAQAYDRHWNSQLGKEREYYDMVRAKFNKTGEPALLLYLLARCVKGAVRYNSHGEFNQSPDNRRKGALPETMRRQIRGAHRLLTNRATVRSVDYGQLLDEATPADVVYMDPPYQGVSLARDQRYFRSITFDEFTESLARLNERKISFVLSYDGRTGSKAHGKPLPSSLRLKKLEVDAGRSSQATLLGKGDRTVESLFVSEALTLRVEKSRPPMAMQATLPPG